MTRFFSASLVLWLLASVLTACGNASSHASSVNDEPPERGVPVAVHSVTTGDLQASLRAQATLEPLAETDVTARVDGIVEDVLVAEGDYVQQGQPLARLDDRRYRLAYRQIKAELQGVEQELTRLQKLASQQMVSSEQLERLTANYESLQAKLELAELDLAETTIRAPITGYITEHYVRSGNMIQAHQSEQLFHIVDDRQLRAVIHLPESARSQLASGQAALLNAASGSGEQSVPARVDRISPVTDARSGTFRVYLLLDNQQYQLPAGSFARIRLHYAERESVPHVTENALLELDQQQHVFVVRESRAHRVPVETGLRANGQVEITAGLTTGDLVVINGQQTLRDQALVEVTEP